MVIEYVTNKYGQEHVSHIITFGTMAAKNAIKDVARVYNIAPTEANAITKTIPNKPGITIETALKETPEFANKIRNNQVYEKVVNIAQKIEGLPRQTGVHACFDENTLIRTDTGMKRIADIKVGDKVLTDKGRFKKVINTIITESNDIYKLYPSAATPFIVTGNHPILVKENMLFAGPRWKAVEDISESQYICVFKEDLNKHWEKVKKVEKLNLPTRKMYNLTVEDDHTYTANGVIVHNCGICIGQKTIDEYCPTARVKDDNGEYFMTTQFEGPEAEEVGLVKFDFLGLRTLDTEDIALELIRENEPDFSMTPDEIPINDISSYLMLKEGQTDGVFQFESDGMTSLVKQMFGDVKPTDSKEKGDEYFERLTAAVALYRPGPLDEIPNYLKAMKSGDIVYDHPKLKSILSSTYGILVYQEEIMMAVRELAGFSKGAADTIRKAMGLFWPD